MRKYVSREVQHFHIIFAVKRFHQCCCLGNRNGFSLTASVLLKHPHMFSFGKFFCNTWSILE